MLDSIVIDGFMRIAETQLNLKGHAVHLFAGDNEAGKSSLLEAIAFALRGISPRVQYKKQFDELVFRGHKNGSIRLLMDGFDITRTIKQGALTTAAPLDFHELLVDILLGREHFGQSDPIKVKQMMTKTFNVESSVEYIKGRLLKKGILETMVDRVVPLIKAGGFATASETAKSNELIKRGEWERLTGEKYGSVKAQTWTPPDADQYQEVTQEQLDAQRLEVQAKKSKHDFAQQSLGAIRKAKEDFDKAEQLEAVEDIETHLQSLTDVQKAYQDELNKLRESYQSELSSVDTEIGAINEAIQQAKMMASTLECPVCMAALKLKIEGSKTGLVRAEVTKPRDGASLESLQESLRETQDVRASLVSDRTAKIQKIEKNLISVQTDRINEEKKLEIAKAAKPVTEDELVAAEDLAKTANQAYEEARTALAKLENDKTSLAAMAKRKQDADALHVLISQWALASDLLSNKPESIPSELIQRTTKPINTALMEICAAWNQLPIVVDAGMTLTRGDGTAYYLMSESAKWRADVAIQLALAKLGPLKLVAIDRFDVLQPSARAEFFDMIEWYSKQNPNVTVLITGTLKSKPNLGGLIKTWWIEDGEIAENEKEPA